MAGDLSGCRDDADRALSLIPLHLRVGFLVVHLLLGIGAIALGERLCERIRDTSRTSTPPIVV